MPTTTRSTGAELPPYVVVVAAAEKDYPDVHTVLKPFSGDVSKFVNAAAAYQSLAKDGMFTPATTDVKGVVNASLYNYYNGAHGQIQPDGSVKLDYQGTPVWAFTARLGATYAPLVAGGPSNPYFKATTSTPIKTCVYVVIVDATTGGSLTAGPECKP